MSFIPKARDHKPEPVHNTVFIHIPCGGGNPTGTRAVASSPQSTGSTTTSTL